MVIGLVTVIAGLTGFTQVREISSATGALRHGALPILMNTAAVERDLSRIRVTLERANFARSLPQLNKAQTSLDSQITNFRTQISQLLLTPGTIALTEQIESHLGELDNIAHQLITKKRESFEITRSLTALQQQIDNVASDASMALRSLLKDSSDQVDIALERIRSDASPAADVIDQLFSGLFLNALNLTSLSMGFETTTELARTDATSGDVRRSAELERTLKQRLESFTTRLTGLTASPQKSQLIQAAADLERLLVGRDGLVIMGRRALQNRETLQSLREQHITLSGELSTFARDLGEQAKMVVDKKSAALGAATRWLSMILVVCLFLAAIITTIGNSIIIEQQFNRRMERLSKAVRAIAGGDLKHPIDIDGRDELGDVARALTIFKDNAEELRRSNKELEQFAYVAAHDLRSPLRAIHDLADWTLQDDENALSEDSGTYLKMLQSRAKRLDRLLADLLNYARAGSQKDGLVDIELRAFVEEIWTMLDPPKSFSLRYSGLNGSVRTYATPLKQILINLISNAVKHNDQNTGTLSISTKAENGWLIFDVADDGPGIPPEYQTRIYQLFQTLRPRDEVEGSGLGLAIIRKLLERYKGDISLHSDPDTGRGARFRVRFPGDTGLAADERSYSGAA